MAKHQALLRAFCAFIGAGLGLAPAGWALASHAKKSPGHALHHKAVRHAKPGPAPAAVFLHDLNAALRQGRLAGNAVNAQMQNGAIQLEGWVRGAENRGRATEVARLVARHDRWRGVHIYNHVRVKPLYGK